MITVSTPVQNRLAYGSSSVNGATPRIDTQITYLRPIRSPIGPPIDRARRDRREEHEQMDLRGLHRQMELVDQIEREVAGDAGQVEVLREHQQHQHAHREHDLVARQRRVTASAPRAFFTAGCRLYQRPMLRRARRSRRAPPPRTTRCCAGRAESRSTRRAAARATNPHCRPPGTATARGRAGRPTPCAPPATIPDGTPTIRSRPAPPRPAARRKLRRDRHQQQTREREAHADRQRIRLRMLVGIDADQRLQQRRRDLVGQRDQADLPERQREVALQHRIDRQDQRLDHVVEQVREADRAEHGIDRALDLARRGRRR